MVFTENIRIFLSIYFICQYNLLLLKDGRGLNICLSWICRSISCFQPCNQYKAGEITDSIRSKGRNAKYDEKAVLGRICRHGHPKGFISLKHGERYALTNFMFLVCQNPCFQNLSRWCIDYLCMMVMNYYQQCLYFWHIAWSHSRSLGHIS